MAGAKRGRKSSWETKIEPRLLEIAAWCRDGHTEEQMSKALGISRATLYKFKLEKVELLNALRINKAIADITVENSLYKRANGYKYKETTREIRTDKDGNVVSKYVKEVEKEVLPDTTAMMFFLKNRKRDIWKDKWSDDSSQQPIIFNVDLGRKDDR